MSTQFDTSKEVNDEEKQSQNATIRRINKYRDKIAEYHFAVSQNEMTMEVSEEQQHRAYHQMAKGFCRLLEPYLTDGDISQSAHYWEDVNLGNFEIAPPDVVTPPSREEMGAAVRYGDKTALARGSPRNHVDAKNYSVIGLRDFANAPAEWQVEWTVMFGPEVSPLDIQQQIRDDNVRVAERSHRNEPITVVRTARIPRGIINNAVTAMENFVRDLDLDLDFSDSGLPEWGFYEVDEDAED